MRKVIKRMKSEGRRVHVLDIGTGTGLLSMMAVRCGADEVTACEAFAPMIDVAKRCLTANGMRDKVRLVEKRSTDVRVGAGLDMSERANVLVTEVFDTELIGEGAIATFSHALEHLLTPDAYVIPDQARMYVQCVDSTQCERWNWLRLGHDDEFGLRVPPAYDNLAGDSICDVQLTQFDDFKPLTPAIPIFEY